jgi:hypothetical protein
MPFNFKYNYESLEDELFVFYEVHDKIIMLSEGYYRDYHHFKENNIDLKDTYFKNKENLKMVPSEEQHYKNEQFKWIINGIKYSLKKKLNGSKHEKKYLLEKLNRSLLFLNDENTHELFNILVKWSF